MTTGQPPARDQWADAATWGRLRTFLAVADTGSVRAAAQALHVTPPAVSAAVTALERELGAPLVVRSGRGIRLSEAGGTFASYCRRLLGLLEEAALVVRQADQSRLRLGSVATASEFVLAPLMASFARRYPHVELTLSVHPRDELFDELRHHQIDLVLAGRPPQGSEFVTRARRPTSLIVVGAPSMADIGRTGPAALAHTWLLRGPGSGTRETTLALLDRLQSAPPTLTLGTHGAVLAAVREGLGVTLVHADAVAAELARGDLVVFPLPGTPLKRPWHLSSRPGGAGAADLFVAHVCVGEAFGDQAFTDKSERATLGTEGAQRSRL